MNIEIVTSCFNTLSSGDATDELHVHDDMVWHPTLTKQL